MATITKTLGRLATAALLLTGGTVALGDGPQWEHVSADAKWVVHVDMDAMRDSQVIKAIDGQGVSSLATMAMNQALATAQKQSGGKTPLILNWSAQAWESGFDGIHDVTVYGSRVGIEGAVKIIHGNWSERSAAANQLEKGKLDADPTARRSQHNGHDVYTWETASSGLPMRISMGIADANTVLIAVNKQAVEAGLDVIDGTGENLDGQECDLKRDVPEGTLFLARGTDLTKADFGPLMQSANFVRSFEYVAAEADGTWLERATAVSDSVKNAERLLASYRGLKGMVALSFREVPAVAELVETADFEQESRTVRIRYEGNAESVVAAVEPAVQAVIQSLKSQGALLERLARPEQRANAGQSSTKTTNPKVEAAERRQKAQTPSAD